MAVVWRAISASAQWRTALAMPSRRNAPSSTSASAQRQNWIAALAQEAR